MNSNNQERNYFYSANIYGHSLDFIKFIDGVYTESNPEVEINLVRDKIVEKISSAFKIKIIIHLISFNRV